MERERLERIYSPQGRIPMRGVESRGEGGTRDNEKKSWGVIYLLLRVNLRGSNSKLGTKFSRTMRGNIIRYWDEVVPGGRGAIGEGKSRAREKSQLFQEWQEKSRGAKCRAAGDEPKA